MYRVRSATACLMFGVLGVIGCASEGEPPPEPAAQAYRRAAAERAIGSLADATTRASVLGELRARGPVALAELPALAGVLRDPGPGAVPEAWLLEGAGDDAGLLVAWAPSGDERSWTEVPAYRLDGTQVALDPYHPPAAPVLVIETHGRLALRQSIAEANLALQRAGLQRGPMRPVPSAAGEVTRLDSIRLNDDLEPWVSGSAEIYAIVSGVVANNVPELHAVELPYLDNDGTTYTPNQVIIDWSLYAFQAVNVQLFEKDDNTNFQELISALVQAIGAIGTLAGRPQIQAITEIANRIISAMPAGWFANDDDYVDSFYTLEKTRQYINRLGAGRNATVTLTPFVIAPN